MSEKSSARELQDDEQEAENDLAIGERALVADLKVEATEDRVHVSGFWGESVFGTFGEDVESAFEALKQFALRQDDPRPNADAGVYRTTDDETFHRCLHCDQLGSAEHHDRVGERVFRCRWDDINDFDVFDEHTGRVVECPSCGSEDVLDRPSEHVERLFVVECEGCGEEFSRESHDWGDYDAGRQVVKNSEYEVVADVK